METSRRGAGMSSLTLGVRLPVIVLAARRRPSNTRRDSTARGVDAIPYCLIIQVKATSVLRLIPFDKPDSPDEPAGTYSVFGYVTPPETIRRVTFRSVNQTLVRQVEDKRLPSAYIRVARRRPPSLGRLHCNKIALSRHRYEEWFDDMPEHRSDT